MHDMTIIVNKLLEHGFAKWDSKKENLSGSYTPSLHSHVLTADENKYFLEVLHEASDKDELKHCNDNVEHRWNFQVVQMQ